MKNLLLAIIFIGGMGCAVTDKVIVQAYDTEIYKYEVVVESAGESAEEVTPVTLVVTDNSGYKKSWGLNKYRFEIHTIRYEDGSESKKVLRVFPLHGGEEEYFKLYPEHRGKKLITNKAHF